MGKFGRERVEKELQWSVVSANLLAAYEFVEVSDMKGAMGVDEIRPALMKLE